MLAGKGLISAERDAWPIWLLCSEWPKQIWPLVFCLLNLIQIFNYWSSLVTHCQYLSQIWANSQRFNLEQHQSTIINTNVGAIQCTGNIMHHVKHATAKKSINMLHSQRCEIWYHQNKRGVKYNIFQNIKFISNKHLSVANNLMKRPNHLIHHLISSPVLPAALLHSPFHHYLHNMAHTHACTYAHTSSKNTTLHLFNYNIYNNAASLWTCEK